MFEVQTVSDDGWVTVHATAAQEWAARLVFQSVRTYQGDTVNMIRDGVLLDSRTHADPPTGDGASGQDGQDSGGVQGLGH